MAEKSLSEKFVQNTVAEQLNKRYYRRKSAYVNTEVYTRLKRADVLLAFMRSNKRPYVVVVEAKSRTTIHQLKLKENPDRTRWVGRIITAALIALLSVILGYQWYFNALNTLLLLGLFVAGSALISSIVSRMELSLVGSIGAIEQLARYPANEKWIAIGEDSFVRPDEYQTLRRQCRKNGIGLIVVTRKGKMSLRVIPEPRHTFNNYLGKYGKEKSILAIISKQPDYGSTPPERRKKRRQLLNSALLLAIIGTLALIGYEESHRPIVPDPFEESFLPVDEENGGEESEEVDDVPGPEQDGDTLAGPAGAEDTATGCEALTVTQRSFIVVDALLKEKLAEQRLEELNRAGIDGLSAIPTDCLNSWPAPGRIALYTGIVYPNRPTAAAAAKAYNLRLKEIGISRAYGRPVKVRPPVQE
ncbi:hypothetical protein [Neolewinella agarilytica]|uniref:Uncharacterized protein n=1 Tax=Neolewinella agarilytica TaxID=478744 RepID=A0A1H9G1J1_9BACT|nr:hypothetical protein [Neolewinella agarilytica]SEQ43974.1 hypothetical protein SAMN05444359_1103 [Neolewinella agarilytica]